jgi:hypothetical protein
VPNADLRYIDFQRKSSFAQGKGNDIQCGKSAHRHHPVNGLIEIPGSLSPSIDVGDVGKERHKGYCGIGLYSQNIREDISLAEKTDHGYQPNFGLVVNSHESFFSTSY